MKCAIEYNSNNSDGFCYAGHDYNTHLDFFKISDAMDFMKRIALFQPISASPISHFALYKGEDTTPTEIWEVTKKGTIRKA